MDQLRIRGGRPLDGRIPISGAKNAALPLLAASLLSPHPLVLDNVPALADIESMLALLAHLGGTAEGVPPATPATVGTLAIGASYRLCAGALTSSEAPYDLVRKMRASVLVLGPLLARTGRARVSLPGGCAIGNRPVDLHVKALTALGAEVTLDGGYIEARVPADRTRLTGARVVFPIVSVGATENAMMAAALADGRSELVNAAREPEIVDLATCLNAMGARVSGAGGDTIVIEGVSDLRPARHRVIPDRIETGTFAIAAALTGGRVELVGARGELIEAVTDALRQAGVTVEDHGDTLLIAAPPDGLNGVDVMTEPYPGFPTDLQAQFMVLMAVAQGAAMVTETIFENRFMHVPELARMGANINVHHSSALVRGVPGLTGAPVMATDLRASVSLVMAGLVASGETTVNRVYHLDRGYECLVEKLTAVGADITRVGDNGGAGMGEVAA
ncbi:MAG: UDP-N-acetylglucosamine 1-carboxyvinyltransferase [Pseudomonadota bacterium]|nr:UDP-N-acetylglucosamine 1-carboxyvinyltransferase [Pseudomonadota bacterium]